jgi:hypothetical protein
MKRLFLISASLVIASSAFAQSQGCTTAPVSVTGSQVTLTSDGGTVMNKQMYIYYERRHHRHQQPDMVAGINDQYPSTPILLNNRKIANTAPTVYNVSLSTPESNVTICRDSALNITANINVEKVSSYTGNYPGSTGDDKEYTKVRKHTYKVAARKMRKIERNEEKLARKTGTTVEVKSDRKA